MQVSSFLKRNGVSTTRNNFSAVSYLSRAIHKICEIEISVEIGTHNQIRLDPVTDAFHERRPDDVPLSGHNPADNHYCFRQLSTTSANNSKARGQDLRYIVVWQEKDPALVCTVMLLSKSETLYLPTTLKNDTEHWPVK